MGKSNTHSEAAQLSPAEVALRDEMRLWDTVVATVIQTENKNGTSFAIRCADEIVAARKARFK